MSAPGIDYPHNVPQIHFAVQRLVPWLERHRLGDSLRRLHIHANATDLPPEAYRLRFQGDSLEVAGGDAAGAMYGTLELIDQLRLRGGLAHLDNLSQTPRFPFRAAKFNLPWSSYRPGEAMRLHLETCRRYDFWTQWLDLLAESRFNALTLWNLHPFPYLINVEGYPEAWLFSEDELESWSALWRFIFREAKNRNLETYLVFWNIFVSPSLAKAWGIDYSHGEYHNGPGETSARVQAYNRACVTQLIDSYPDLTGIGTAMGERMAQLAPQERQQWVDATVVAGMKAASRPVKFIYRAPFTDDPLPIRRSIEQLNWPEPVYVEYKFNWSHGHSTPNLVMTHTVDRAADDIRRINDAYWNPPPETYRMVWMVRNEDFFSLRWGSPGFIREHIANNGQNFVAGYITGSEGMIPAQEYTRVAPAWDYLFQRNWLAWRLWGRLLYDPDTPDDTFAAMLNTDQPEHGRQLLQAFDLASQVPLRIAAFYAATWDYTLYAEGFLAPRPSHGEEGYQDQMPFISVERLLNHPTLDPRLLSVKAYADLVSAEQSPAAEQQSPLDLADELSTHSSTVLDLVAGLENSTSNEDPVLADTLADLRSWAHLGQYVAAKLRGATALALYRRGGDADRQRAAVDHLTRAAEHWAALVTSTQNRIKPFPLLEHNDWALTFHWADYQAAVAADIDICLR